MYVYTGSFTEIDLADHGRGRGIYRFELDTEGGALSGMQLAAEAPNPNYVLFSRDGTRLYSVAEASFTSEPSGTAVRLYDVDRATGALTLRSSVGFGVTGPCHMSLDPRERAVFVGCYTGGGAVMVPLGGGGDLGDPVEVRHEGSSVNPERQEAPHPHSANVTADGRFLHVPDLGIDRVVTYRVEHGPARLTRISDAASAPGAGPRHLAFTPDGAFAYVMGEMASTIMAFRCESDGGLTHLQTLSSLPAGYSGENSTADVRMHPRGHVVYCSNRGHDSIAVFSIDRRTGELAPLGHVPTGGQTPRGFNVDASGTWLLAANEQSDSVFSFRVDGDDGMPVPTGSSIEVPRPTSVAFAPA
jgi:6-phosphogluconolactonase